MDGFKAYRYYLAIKLHFTKDKFNVFENRGNVKGTRESFVARNDRYIFEKLANKFSTDKDIIQFFVSNFAYGSGTAIYDGKEADDNYTEWLRRKQSITKIFVDDLATLMTEMEVGRLSPDSLFISIDGEYPLLLKLFVGGKISIETIRIIDDLHPIVESWKDIPSVKYIWEDELRRITKLTGFVKYDKIKLGKIFETFREELAE
jgi:hypothetical protein